MVLTVRNGAKGKDALTQTGYTIAELWITDLASFSSIIAFADRAEYELE